MATLRAAMPIGKRAELSGVDMRSERTGLRRLGKVWVRTPGNWPGFRSWDRSHAEPGDHYAAIFCTRPTHWCPNFRRRHRWAVGGAGPPFGQVGLTVSKSIANEIERLLVLSLPKLRQQWHEWHPDRVLPDRLPRDLLVRTIAWRMQEKEFGSFPAALERRLAVLSAQLQRSGTLDMEREVAIKPGTRILRDWRGETYRVTALEEGFAYDNREYASLSEVARAITGTRWSGPRFFGLPQRSGKGRSSSESVPHG